MATPLYIEASAFLSKDLTGIGRFVARLVEALAQEVPLRLTTTLDRNSAKRYDLSTKLARGNEIALTADLLPDASETRQWVSRILDLPLIRSDPERLRSCPILYTMLRPAARHFRRELCVLYDFTPLITPQFHLPQTCESYGTFLGQTSGVCDAAIAISESTRLDADWLGGIDAARVFTHYPGPSQCVHAHAHSRAVKRRDDLIVIVSTLEPRKNAPFVLDWFTRSPVLPREMRLCWVGPRGWMTAFGKKPSGPAARRIEFAGTISDAELCRLYREATFSIYPSLYEGFGLPVLDSLWHDCPVAASYHSSLTEFAMPGVFFFDPCDPDTLDDVCRDLLSVRDEICIDREGLAQRFSWREMARAVVRYAFAEPFDRVDCSSESIHFSRSSLTRTGGSLA